MKRHINNPYKLNWKMYTLIGVVSVSVMTFAVIHNNATGSTVSDIIKNLAFGCVASTLVACLIEIGNIKGKNEKANSVYDAVYIDLKCQIMWYVQTWACLCSVAYKGKDYRNEKHTWLEWYEIAKSKFTECDGNRQAELLRFFSEQLKVSTDGVEKAIEQIESQQYLLNLNGMYDEKLRIILADYGFEFDAVTWELSRDCKPDDFWRIFDAIKLDLEKYIYNWIDIRYYNYCKFEPYKFYGDKEEITRAMRESEKASK